MHKTAIVTVIFIFTLVARATCNFEFSFESSDSGWSGDFYRTSEDAHDGTYSFRSPAGEYAYETVADSIIFMTGTVIGWFKGAAPHSDVHIYLRDTSTAARNVGFIINPGGTDNPHYTLSSCDTSVGEPHSCPIPNNTWFKAKITIANSGTVYVDATEGGYPMQLYVPDCVCSIKQLTIHAWSEIFVDSIAVTIDRLAPMSIRDSLITFFADTGASDTQQTRFYNPGCTDINIDSVIISPPFYFVGSDSGVAMGDSGQITFVFSPTSPGHFVDTAYIYYDSLVGCPVPVALEGQTPCYVQIDSVWFSEETECNDSNIVQICYHLSSTCPDSSFDVTIRISPDSGTTWVNAGEGWFSTLTDTAGDLGAVDTGLHCFHWIMNEDTVAEGRNWMLEVTVRELMHCAGEVVWNLSDSIFRPIGNGQDITSMGSSLIMAVDGIVPDDTVICLLEYSKCTGELIRADTIWVDAAHTSQGLTYAFGYIWVSGLDGKIFKLDPVTWDVLGTYWVEGASFFEGLGHDDSLIYAIDGSSTRIVGFYPDSFVAPDTFASIVEISVPFYDYEGISFINGQFWCVTPGRIYVYNYDGSLDTYYNSPLPTSSHGISFDGCYLFVSGRTSSWVYVYGDSHWDESWLCPLKDSVCSALDSRPPGVNLVCPAESVVSPNDTISLHWTVIDSFWGNQPCSLHIHGAACGYDTTITVADTTYNWVVTPGITGCDTLWFVVAARDSFCNWGYDSCSVAVCRPGYAELLCGPCEGFSSCSYQIVQWEVHDSNGIAIDPAEIYVSVIAIHPDGTADTTYISGVCDSLLLEPVGGDSSDVIITLQDIEFLPDDSVWVTLDSIFNAAGCRIAP